MIIECPACNTRYEIKVDLPPEGRTVRCAKCENVWRAVPLEEEEPFEDPFEEPYAPSEDYEPGEAEGSGNDADAGRHAAGGWGHEVEEGEEEAPAPAFHHGYHQDAEEEEEAAPAFLHGHRQAAEEVEETAPAFLHGYRQAARMQEDEGFSPAGDPDFSSARLASAMENAAEQEPAAPAASGGKVGWFGSFLRKSPKQAPAAQAGFSHPEPEPMPAYMPRTEAEPDPSRRRNRSPPRPIRFNIQGPAPASPRRRWIATCARSTMRARRFATSLRAWESTGPISPRAAFRLPSPHTPARSRMASHSGGHRRTMGLACPAGTASPAESSTSATGTARRRITP